MVRKHLKIPSNIFSHCEKISSILHSALCILHLQFIGLQIDKLQFESYPRVFQNSPIDSLGK